MHRQKSASLPRVLLVLSFSLLVVMLGGLLKPEAAVQPISLGVKTHFDTGNNPVSAIASTAAQFSQQGPKLVGTGAVGAANQGFSVAVSADGNTAIVGGWTDNGQAGSVWVWTRSGGVWTQQGPKLVGTGAVGTAAQGFSVAISADGNTAIVGGWNDNGGTLGAVWVWTRSGGVWTQQGSKLVGTGAVGVASQGRSVSISADGNTVIIGGNADNNLAGAAWIWTRSGGVWTQQGNKLVGSGAVGNAQQGDSVAISADGNTAIVGGTGDDGFKGAAWVWTRSGGVWTQQGNKLVGSGAVGSQGYSVSISADGNTAIVGERARGAWVWTRSGGIWTQQGSKLVGSDGVGDGEQGISVSLSADGNTAIIGGDRDNNDTGAAWVWMRSGGIWSQHGSKLVGSGATGNAFQGVSVSVSADGKTAIIGGPVDNSGDGATWVFTASQIEILDTDEDGLPDDWERSGYTLSGHFVDLPAMGANPNHKDVFVEVDYMTGHKPDQTKVIDRIVQSFANAPVTNPDGIPGITLHVRIDEEVPHVDELGSNSGGVYNWSAFDVIKQAHFDEALSLSHHYCIFAHNGPRNVNGFPNSGIARGTPSGVFIVSLGSWPSGHLLGVPFGEGGTASDQAGTFMHELGHNLGLFHGGFENALYKPNYLSVMNYSFQLSGLRYNGANGLFDYSRFSLPSLNEMHLDERIGLNGGSNIDGYGTTWFCGSKQPWISNANGAINWNCNMTFLFFDNIENDIATDVNQDNHQTTLLSFNDWENLNFKGGSIGAGAPSLPEMETVVDEINLITAKSILPAPPVGLAGRLDGCTVQLSWTSVGVATEYSYKLYRGTEGGSFVLIGSTVSTSVSDSSAELMKTNSYYVSVVNSLGSESDSSNVVTVTVNDTQPPTITCPANITAKTATINNSCVAVSFTATANDSCPGVTAVCSPASGSCFPVGTTTVNCSATDASGNTAICSFTVAVFNVGLQDDSNLGTVFLGNTITGAYRFCCGGTTFTGIAQVTKKGSTATFQQNGPDRKMLAKYDGAVSSGSASFQSSLRTCTIIDRDTRNNTRTCQ